MIEPSLDPPGDSLRRHRNGETVETERLCDTPRVAGFSTVSDTKTEMTGSKTPNIALLDYIYELWQKATL